MMKDALRKSRKVSQLTKLTIFILALLFLVFIFLATIIIKKNAIQEIEDNVQLCISLAKYAESNERYSFVEQCKIYLGKSCTSHNQCSPFPCIKNECSIKPCNNDNDCQESLCGKYLAIIHNFCTTIDAK